MHNAALNHSDAEAEQARLAVSSLDMITSESRRAAVPFPR